MKQGKKEQRITIADVAKQAGVSRTTVSHALNGVGQVDPKTRARVKQVAAELNYRPNVRAQRLRSGKAQAIALLSSMSPAVSAGPSQLGFFTELAMGCARTALNRGYVLVLAPPSGKEIVSTLDIDGAILLEPLPNDPLGAELTARGIPYVTIDNETSTASVSLNHGYVARMLLDHLSVQGAKNVGLLISSSERASQQVFKDVYVEFATAHEQAPIIHEVPEEEGEAGAYRGALKLLTEQPHVDALCVPIDAFAVGALAAAKELGREVGQDLLMAARYNGIRAQTASPPLTSVDLHLPEVSGRAVDLLLDHLGAPKPKGERAPLPTPTLIERPSSRS